VTRHPGWALTGLFVLVAVPLAVWVHGARASARERDDKIAAEVPQQARDGYVTSNKCEACHPAQYESWRRGFHHTMTQYASPESVKGNFHDVMLDAGGYTVKL